MIAVIKITQFDEAGQRMFLEAVTSFRKELNSEVMGDTVIVEAPTQNQLMQSLAMLCEISSLEYDYYTIDKPKTLEGMQELFSPVVLDATDKFDLMVDAFYNHYN